MATRCDLCGKKPTHGNAVSHSMRHTKRRWLPNVQHATLLIQGVPVKLSVCTRCLRTQRKTAAAK